MNYTKHIQRNYRKAFALLFMLYFTVSPLLLAIPKETCSDSCPMNNEGTMHCTIMANHNSSMKNVKCEAEFSTSKCNPEKEYTSNFKYIITHKYSANIYLPIIFIINHSLIDNYFQSFDIVEVLNQKESPPIYISVASLLI